MKVTIEDKGGCRRLLHIEASAEAVAEDYGKVVASYRKAAKIPGFRPGRAPVGVVEKRYGSDIAASAKERLVPSIYQAAIAQESIAPEAVVAVDAVAFDKDRGLSFDVTVDIAPEFKLPKYHKISLKRNDVSIADKDVDEALGHLLDRYARFEEVSGRPVMKGDLVKLDFEGTIEGRPIKELGDDCSAVGESEDFWIVVGERELLPGMSEGIEGMAVDETGSVDVEFPDDFRVKSVAGKSASYKVRIKGIQERVRPAIDEEFLKRLSVDTEAALRERIRADLHTAGEQREQGRLRDEIAEFLLSKTEFDLPQAVVQREAQSSVRSMVQRLTRSGATREQIQEQYSAMVGAATQSSANRVKLSYILGKIAAEEGVEVVDAEVAERIQVLATAYRMSPAQLRTELERGEGLEELRRDVRDSKTLDKLLEIAKIK